MRFRLQVRVDCDDVGSRVTVRRRLEDGRLGDVLGILEDCDERSFRVRDRRGEINVILRSEVVAAKVVEPPA